MLRECVTNRAKASLARSKGLDSYRPDGPIIAGSRSMQNERDREPPRSAPSAYKSGRSRHRSRSPDRSSNASSHYGGSSTRPHRSRSPCPRTGESTRDDRSSACSYRSRSPIDNGRQLISYADIGSLTSCVSPLSSDCSAFESRRSDAHIARPRFVSMKDSDPTQYYEFRKDEFKVGTIIRGPVHEEDTNRTPRFSYATSRMSEYQASRIQSHVSHTPHGAVWSESRFLIVVEAFGSHYMAVPLFTYEGTGLRHKPDRNEYVSIQDHRYPGTSREEAPHTLLTEHLAHSVKAMKPASVAHLTAPISRKYQWHVRYQGRLTARDTALLVQLYNNKGRS